MSAEILKLIQNLYFEYTPVRDLSSMTDLDRKHFIIAQENSLICAFSAELILALTVTLCFMPT